MPRINRPKIPSDIPQQGTLGYRADVLRQNFGIAAYDLIAAQSRLGLPRTIFNANTNWNTYINLIARGMLRFAMVAAKNSSSTTHYTLSVRMTVDANPPKLYEVLIGKGTQGGFALCGAICSNFSVPYSGISFGVIPFETLLKIEVKTENNTNMPVAATSKYNLT